jgi:ligand-binding sensor domain-containing protein/signal transduction histidine kinase
MMRAAYASLGLRLSLALVASALLCGEQLAVKTYTTADGLARDRVGCIVQDPRGFLWFCAGGLLSRFDGYTFTSYGTKQGLPNQWVTGMQITQQGVYWVGTLTGLFRLDPNSPPPQRFEQVPIGTNENAQHINDLVEDQSGGLWAGTNDGLYRLEVSGRPVFQPVDVGIPRRADGKRPADVLLRDRRGSLWIAADRLYRRTADGRITAFAADPFGTRHVVPGFGTLYEDREGRLWVGNQLGLYRLNPDAGPNDPIVTRLYTMKDGLPHDRVDALLETSEGRFWAGTARGLGYYVPDADRFEGYTKAQGLSDGGIKSLAEDREGNLWVGTEAGGVMKMAHRGFTSYTEADGLNNTRIASIIVDQAGELCAVTSLTAGKWSLDCFNGKRFRSIRPNYPSTMHYFGWGWNQTAFQDHRGEWWIPTGEGLCRFGKTSRAKQLAGRAPKAVYTTQDGLPQDDIFRLFEDSRGDIWICGVGQMHNPLTRWERATGSFHVFSDADGLPRIQQSATAFAEDRSGQIWIGYYGSLARFHNGRFRLYSEADGLPAGRISALHPDHAGRLWIAASQGGLGRIDNPSESELRFTQYTADRGLSDNAVTCITEDQWGRIYVGTARGVDSLDPAIDRIKHYTTADGLTRGEINVARRDRDGALWFGTGLGLSRLIPEPDRPGSPPPVLITGVQVRGIPQPLAAFGANSVPQLTLRPNQNQIRLDFVGLGFALGGSLRYQYRLEGADRDWSAPTDQRSVNYASLRPGSYTFQVRALNVEGSISPRPASVIFAVLSPVWQRWWFLSSAGVALSLLIYALYRYRVAQLLAVERVRIRIATDLHDDIGSSLSQIAILSEVARRKIENADLQAAEPLSDIATVSGELVDSMSDIVWSINPKHDHLSDLEHRMRRFATDVLTARSISLEFRVTATQPDLRIGADIRRQVFLIFKEAVNNIARHSRASRATVELNVAQEHLTLRITDNGTGFDPTDCGEGNGLINIRKRATDLGGTAVFESRSDQGTILTLRVPLTYQRWGGRRIRK